MAVSPRRLTTGKFAESYGSWSHDGRWVYFISNRGDGSAVWKIPAGGGSPVQVAPKAVRPAFESPDGMSVYYGGSDGQIWKVPAAGGQPSPVMKKGKRALWCLGASGINILDPDAAGGPTIELFPFASGVRTATRRLSGEPDSYTLGFGALAVSPDGRWILYEHRDRVEADIMLVENFR